MVFILTDVETTGPIPNIYSMTEIGAVVVNRRKVKQTFYGRLKPISDNYVQGAMDAIGYSHKYAKDNYDDPKEVMEKFAAWIKSVTPKGDRPVFISDNNGFDWSFINYYFHYFLGKNPFGFSSRRVGDIYAGMKMDMSKHNDWRKLATTKHTHNPVDDAMEVTEALLAMKKMGLKKMNPRPKKKSPVKKPEIKK
jgi:DNA polymerase III epsilon subunit-like protein